ncbi:MAG: PIG-L family deacetylase [Anaerolineae bacterium]
MADRRILIAMAHPDDESFGLGGLIAKYVDAGVDVYLICSTNGDAGTIDPELLEGYESKAALRLAELDCAAEKLGFKEVFKLGYKDSGMMGAPENNDPESSWSVWNHHPAELVQRVTEIIRQVKPQVVITFNRYGGYGHPDHIAIQRATTEAFHKAGDAAYTDSALPPYQPQKLYYTSIPRYFVQIGIWRARMKRQDPRKMGRNNDIDLIAIMQNAEPPTVRVDIQNYMQAWTEANACHVSQGGGRMTITPPWLRMLLGTRQGLTRIFPAPVRKGIDEADLFTAVTLDEEVPVP